MNLGKNILMRIMRKKICVIQFNVFLVVQQFICSSFMIYDFMQNEGYRIIYGLDTILAMKYVYLKPWVE